MKIPLTFGFLMALGGAVMTLVMYLAGLHDTPEKMNVGQWVGTIGGVAIGITCITLAMRAKRAGFPADGEWGYGSALGAGVLTGMFAAILGAAFAYLYFAYINPGMCDVIMQMQATKMEERGMTAAQIERAEPMIRKWMTPGAMTFFQAFFGFLWTVILSLIIAIFMRKRPAIARPTESPPLLG